MNLRAIGCNVASAGVEVRERLAFNPVKAQKALSELNARFATEAVVLDTCNRVEIYVSRPETVAPLHVPLMAEFLSGLHGVPADQIAPHLYEHADAQAAKHLFRVASGLDSVVLGEGQIAGQVKDAYESALKLTATGPLLNALFPAALRVSKRVRTETGIAHGHVSVSSAAVDFVRQVFDTFTDKTVLVIGAGMAGLSTARRLQELDYDVILLEARQRSGGRVWTDRSLGLPLADILDPAHAYFEDRLDIRPQPYWYAVAALDADAEGPGGEEMRAVERAARIPVADQDHRDLGIERGGMIVLLLLHGTAQEPYLGRRGPAACRFARRVR